MVNVSNSDYAYELLKKGLDASALRGKVIANNIANINTKGYKRSTVTFEENLKDAVDSLDLKTTDSRHIQDGSSDGDIEVVQDNTSSMRQDGNNVDIDNEMSNQAANTLMYNALITQANSKLALERYIINGGK